MAIKKNIVVIISDQLSASALPVYGNNWIQTPNIDRICKDAWVFDRAYTTCPLCLPARSAMWSGLFPHQTEAMSNGQLLENKILPGDYETLGELLTSQGYACTHFGKTHDSGSLRGFNVVQGGEKEIPAPDAFMYNYDTFQDVFAADQACTYLSQEHQQPIACIVDLNNPHNICGWIGDADNIADDAIEDLPQLPENFHIEDFASRPLPVQYLCCKHNRQQQTCHWDDIKFRQYLAAYRHYVALMDVHVGNILDAIEESGQTDDTLIVFSADHGDNMCSRKMATKHCSMYEETTRVPLMINVPGDVGGRSQALLSHQDILPTLCAYAGVSPQQKHWGRDIGAIIDGSSESLHDYVVSEWYSEWGFTIEPGRMVRTAACKYVHYREQDGEEFYDLKNDPHELVNLIADTQWAEEVAAHRQKLREHCLETDDSYFAMNWKADPMWRSHVSGFHNHQGPAAPAYEGRSL
ncbi:MAG: sulfatase-like hydrolase/transferase [Planctomycetes bacterium]|nr:sulfatase-like hydrolase/transferase [Planctomycetota bacterium]